MKESKGTSIPLVWLIVLLVATIWVGFAIGSIFITGTYIWLAVIIGAGIVGAGVTYFALTSAPSQAHLVKGKVSDTEHVTVVDYKLIHAAPDNKVRAVLVKVTNNDTSALKVDINVKIDGMEGQVTSSGLITGVEIAPGATEGVEVPLSVKTAVGHIASLDILLKKAS